MHSRNPAGLRLKGKGNWGLVACLVGTALTAACGSGAEPGEAPAESGESVALNSTLNYPTKWTLINNTGKALTFSCTCPKPRGLVSPINMTPTPVAARLSKVFQWGSGWYNDGLGLNACTWNCSIKAGTTVTATATFNTDWGENITLRARSTGGLVVER